MYKDKYSNFSKLSSKEKKDKDYRITVRDIPTGNIGIIAIHGGKIEPHTEEIARQIAGGDFGYYCFEQLRKHTGYNLHITSHRFDEPQCVQFVSRYEYVVSIHGAKGDDRTVYLGGRDDALKEHLYQALLQIEGIKVRNDGRLYPGTLQENICNQNARKMGFQIEFSRGIRDNEACWMMISEALHEALLGWARLAQAG